MDYDEVIRRVSYFRNKANLSARETSQRLGYNPQFMKTIEDETIELKVRTLLDFCEVVGITIQDFFYIGENFNRQRKEILELFDSLSDKQQDAVIHLLKTIK